MWGNDGSYETIIILSSNNVSMQIEKKCKRFSDDMNRSYWANSSGACDDRLMPSYILGFSRDF